MSISDTRPPPFAPFRCHTIKKSISRRVSIKSSASEQGDSAFGQFVLDTQERIIRASSPISIHFPCVITLKTVVFSAPSCLLAVLLSALSCTVKQATERLDGSKTFLRDPWHRDREHPNPGHGLTAVLEGGDLLEKVRCTGQRFFMGGLPFPHALIFLEYAALDYA